MVGSFRVESIKSLKRLAFLSQHGSALGKTSIKRYHELSGDVEDPVVRILAWFTGTDSIRMGYGEPPGEGVMWSLWAWVWPVYESAYLNAPHCVPSPS